MMSLSIATIGNGQSKDTDDCGPSARPTRRPRHGCGRNQWVRTATDSLLPRRRARSDSHRGKDPRKRSVQYHGLQAEAHWGERDVQLAIERAISPSFAML